MALEKTKTAAGSVAGFAAGMAAGVGLSGPAGLTAEDMLAGCQARALRAAVEAGSTDRLVLDPDDDIDAHQSACNAFLARLEAESQRQ